MKYKAAQKIIATIPYPRLGKISIISDVGYMVKWEDRDRSEPILESDLERVYAPIILCSK